MQRDKHMTEDPHLFIPLAVRSRTIPTASCPMPDATGWELPSGLISDKEADYLVRKAEAGVGLQ
jgi:hypothetical protein